MNTKSCMGGRCLLRDKCERHEHPDQLDDHPAERLCEVGREREMFFIPINQTKECEAA